MASVEKKSVEVLREQMKQSLDKGPRNSVSFEIECQACLTELGGFINDSAELTEWQASKIVGEIYSRRSHGIKFEFPEILAIAAYINTCKI